MKETRAQAYPAAQQLERLGLAMLRCRPDGSVAAITPAAAALLGFPSAEAAQEVGGTPARFWQTPDGVVHWLSGPLPSGGDLRELEVIGPDESLRRFYFYRGGLPETDGKEEGVWLLVMNPSEILTREARRVLLARLESIGASCGAIGHKLNNLLAGLLGYVTLLRRSVGSESESAQRYLESLDETGRRIQDLTRQLLVIAHKGISYSMQPTDPMLLVRHVVERARQVRPELPVLLEDAGVLPKIEADAAALQEAFEHLIFGTAAVLPATREITLSLRVEAVGPDTAALLNVPQDDYVVAEITHSHAPTREIVRERLFDPYFTYDGKGKGAELDLGKAWGIIALHKGTLTVTPKGAEATHIDVFLPLVKRRMQG